jgi:hypothetical protein
MTLAAVMYRDSAGFPWVIYGCIGGYPQPAFTGVLVADKRYTG